MRRTLSRLATLAATYTSERQAQLLAAAVAAVFVLWILVPISVVIFSKTLAEAGQLGDTFSVVNSLFSALAFLGLILTILQQQRESLRASSAQRQEIEIALRTSRLNVLSTLAQQYRTEILEVSTKIKRVPSALPSLYRALSELDRGGAYYGEPEELRALLQRLIRVQTQIAEICDQS